MKNAPLHRRICRKYARDAGVTGDALRTFGDLKEDEQGVDISEELSVNEGVWWNEFYREMTRDRIRWERTRRSMGRGRCRVVVRWQDVPGEMKGRGNAGGWERRTREVERAVLEMDRNRNRRGGESGGMNGDDANQQMVGLGVMNANAGMNTYPVRSASGGALRDSLRARAIGNSMGMGVNGGVNGGFETQNLGEIMRGRVVDFSG